MLATAVERLTADDVIVFAARSAIVVIAVAVGFRVFGKREMAQLNVYDLAMLMALSNAVQNAMTGGRGNLGIGFAAALAVLAVARVITEITRRSAGVERHVIGSPTLLVNDGVVLRARLRRERVSIDDLNESIRKVGVGGLANVRLAVLEVDGSISVVPYDHG